MVILGNGDREYKHLLRGCDVFKVEWLQAGMVYRNSILFYRSSVFISIAIQIITLSTE